MSNTSNSVPSGSSSWEMLLEALGANSVARESAPSKEMLLKVLQAADPQDEPVPNKSERLRLLIRECIRHGVNTERGITSTLIRRGHFRRITKLLHQRSGPDPIIHLWWQDSNKRYHLHTPTSDVANEGSK